MLDDNDTPIFGAANIGLALGLTKSKAFYALERGFIPATKRGRIWTTTPRRLRTWLNSDAKSEAATA
jgi:hypothetical protein